jgi:hypothetical protein
MRNVQWPTRGNSKVFRRSLLIGVTGSALASVALPYTLLAVTPVTLVQTCAVGGAMFLLGVVGSASHTRRSARRAEIVGSFAGLRVLHAGTSITIDQSRPLLGEYGSRRDAAWAAARCGKWAVLVHAYGHYYVLTGSRDVSERRPVSFRSRAVADVVPALFDDAVPA